jgi:hypothetical protein
MGHQHIILKKNGKRFTKLVHRLVLETYVGPCPEGMEACHNDGNPKNNNLSNLRWDTRKANHADAIKQGTHRGLHNYGENCGTSKLNENKVRIIFYSYFSGLFLQKEIAKLFNIRASLVSLIVSGKRWKHLGLTNIMAHRARGHNKRPQTRRIKRRNIRIIR